MADLLAIDAGGWRRKFEPVQYKLESFRFK